MTYFNPSEYIYKNDNLISEVEDRIEADKVVQSQTRSPGFIPMVYSESFVTIKETSEVLRLAEVHDEIGQVKLTLSTRNSFILRMGHFNVTDIHTNPETKEQISPPHHIHFPTEKHPDLSRKHTYAFPVYCKNSRIEILTCYDNACNINVEGFALPFSKMGG
jgi:hypothetical protein